MLRVYYRNRETSFGKSKPNPAAIRNLASHRKTLFPSGIAAANLLGFTTQMPKRGEIATSALSLPRKLVGKDILILLDFLRHGAKFSALSQKETTRKLLGLLTDQGRLSRLLKVAESEPPRVRAMLSAMGVSGWNCCGLAPNFNAVRFRRRAKMPLCAD